jgi:hypothetical protein
MRRLVYPHSATQRNCRPTRSSWSEKSRCLVGAFFCFCVLLANFSAPPAAAALSSARFSIAFHDEVSGYDDVSAFAMPDEPMTFQVVGGPDGEYSFEAPVGTAAQFGARKWRWTAPHKAGVYTLRVQAPKKKTGAPEKDDVIEVRVFVMVPASAVKNDSLNGYRIGRYPATPLNGNPIYRPPQGFIEVTRQNENTRLSPHFRLKQFVCKQGPADEFPKYVVLHERLPLKLEAVLASVQQAGFDVDTLRVMSGYRTPFYNHAIGDVTYSMHQWGRAADVFVDRHDKGVMDDLNADGRIDLGDSRYLYDLIERLLAQPAFRKLQGGMGFYPATSAHPPFVHVDVRDGKARWKG